MKHGQAKPATKLGLTPEEEVRYCLAAQVGDDAAQERLLEAFAGLLFRLAQRFVLGGWILKMRCRKRG